MLEGAGPHECWLCPRGFLPVPGPGGSANIASGLGGGTSRGPQNFVFSLWIHRETAGVKAKSQEHIHAEGNPEEGKRNPTAPAPHQPGPRPGDSATPRSPHQPGPRPGDTASLEEQPVGTPAHSPLPTVPCPYSEHQKESFCWYFSGAEKQLK